MLQHHQNHNLWPLHSNHHYNLSQSSYNERERKIKTDCDKQKRKNALPLILRRHKINTQYSQYANSSKATIKNQSIDLDKQQSRPCSKIISRFIYKHLQKKINYQYNMYNNMSSSPIITNQHTIMLNYQPTHHRQGQRLQALNHSHHTQNTLLFNNNFKNANKNLHKNYSLGSKQKLGMFKKRKLLNRNMVKQSNQIGNDKTNKTGGNIDSYFDLSCLDQVEGQKLYEQNSAYY